MFADWSSVGRPRCRTGAATCMPKHHVISIVQESLSGGRTRSTTTDGSEELLHGTAERAFPSLGTAVGAARSTAYRSEVLSAPSFWRTRSCDVDSFSTPFALDSQCRMVCEKAAVFSHVRRRFGMQDGATVWLLNLGGVRLGDGYSVLEPTNVIAKYQAL